MGGEKRKEIRWYYMNPYPDGEKADGLLTEAARAAGMRQTQAAMQMIWHIREMTEPPRKSLYGNKTAPWVHPVTLACNALAMGLEDDDVLAACLLYHAGADQGIAADRYREEIGETVREAVNLLVYPGGPGEEDAGDPERMEEPRLSYYRNISRNPLASLVKCLDRCVTMSTMADTFSRDEMARYVRQTELYAKPLLDTVERVLDWKRVAWLLRSRILAAAETYKRLL